jgi:hypothetical protein
MEPTDPGTNNLVAHLGTDGASVPWTPRDIRADRRRRDGSTNDEATAPFVVQAGPRLLLIEQASIGWVLAELRFDRDRCVFRVMWQAAYTWPREAFGVLLSRLAVAAPTHETVDRLTAEFAGWVGANFARVPNSSDPT